MTVSTTDSVVEYVSGGPAFTIPYRFLQNSDIEAVLVKQDGTSETLTGAQYTLTGAGSQSGGTLTSAYAAGFLGVPGASLTISRIMEAVQPTDLRNQGKFLAETHETVFDRLTMLIQQGFSVLRRALLRPIGKNYYDAEGRQIKNLADPTADQDAATMGWATEFIANILATGQGPINNAANVIFTGANGFIGVVQDLAVKFSAVKGAFMVGLKSGGNVGQAITYVTPTMFGAANDGAADDYAAITAAAAYAAVNNVELWLSGSYTISTGLDFSAVRKIRCFNDATIIPTFDTGVAVKWVAASGALIEKPIQEGDMRVSWPARDWTKDRTSFLLQNIYNGRFGFSSSRATRALLMKGLERGCVYNDIDFGVMDNNLVGVWLSSGSAAGWCNANRLFGGRFYGANGVGAGQTVAGSLYETRAGHIYIETTPYACNGNAFIKNSIEWVGTGFRLARMGGLSNRLEPVYCEVQSGDTTWIVDTGTNNLMDLTAVPSASSGYDPDLPGASNRIDVSLATDPKVRGTNSYSSGVAVNVQRTTSATRAAIRAENAGAGPALEARSVSSAANPALALTGPSGVGGVLIPPAGTWTVFNGSKRVSWSMAAIPTTGTWTRGDLIFYTNPSPSGKIGAVCTTSGTPGTWKEFGTIDA